LNAQYPPQIWIDLVVPNAKDELLAALDANVNGDFALIQIHKLGCNFCGFLFVSRSALRCDLF